MRGFAFVLLLSSAVIACSYPALPELNGDGSVDAPGGCTGTAKTCGTDNALYECSASSGQLTKIQDCQYGCSVDHCNDCQASTTFCSGDDLVMCDAGGNIVNPMTCSKGCQASKCNQCTPGTSSCDANGNAVTCGLDGTPGTPMACGTNGCISGICNTCTPSTVTCNGDTLVTCGAAGTIQATSTCAFGCTTTGGSHCKVFTPSYGVGIPTGTQTDLVINSAASLDISNCANSSVTLTTGQETANPTTTTLTSPQVSAVTQTGGSTICVVRFKKLTVSNSGYALNIINGGSNNVLTLEATDDIAIDGRINFANQSGGPVPGATAYTSGGGSPYVIAPGAGGAGGARAGGTGGACTGCSPATGGSSGGGAITNIRTVLSPGSTGGQVIDSGSLMINRGNGGAGGGAIHLLSMTKVTVSSTGKIVLNGFGAPGMLNSRSLGGGGGSGGALVVEAPTVTFSSNALAVANGGGGAGGCQTCSGDFIPTCTSYPGQDGQLSATQAAGGNCNGAGSGGWEASGGLFPNPSNGTNGSAATDVGGGGGGGSSGFIFLRGKTGANVMTSGAVISPAPTIEGVTAN